MTNPTDHELNEVLARVVGVEIFKTKSLFGITQWETRERGVWNPLHDANQMERVEAWLQENEWEYITGWSRQGSNHWAELRNTKKAFWSCDTDKKRAFALAVYAMEQSQKGTT